MISTMPMILVFLVILLVLVVLMILTILMIPKISEGFSEVFVKSKLKPKNLV